ncbi:16890_t:CDS:2, partial [Entrophospora sp. SA101]
ELNVEDVHESGVDADINIIINWNLLGNVGNNLIFLKMILSVYIDSDAGILKSTFNVDNIANDTNGKLQNNFNVLMKSSKLEIPYRMNKRQLKQISTYIDSDAGILKSTFNVDNIANDTNGKLQNNFNVLMKSSKLEIPYRMNKRQLKQISTYI